MIIFGTMCVKAQDKLLQIPNTLNLQCLTVCRYYESLSLHIQQIHPGSDRHIEFLRKRHPKTNKSGQNKPQLKGQNSQKSQSSQQKVTKSQKKCYGCSCNLNKDHARNCPAWVQYAENATNPTIGKLYAVKSQTEGQTETSSLVSGQW